MQIIFKHEIFRRLILLTKKMSLLTFLHD